MIKGKNKLPQVKSPHIVLVQFKGLCYILHIFRMLEEGNLDAAERIKLELEQAQRERRKTMELEGVQHEPRWFK